MRVFVIICIVAVVCGEKQGYNYPASQSDIESQSGNGIAASGLDTDASFDSASYSPPADFDKEFYTFAAPEGEFDDPNAGQKLAGNVKQNLRVVFIKGPENKGLEDAALALAKQAGEQKTAIYVLSRQTDIGDLASKFNANKNANNKPEVHFVKYRTSEDAANAQKAIKDQYNSLSGSSQSHNGGNAPVINFASKSPLQADASNTPGNSYLPSSVFRRRY